MKKPKKEEKDCICHVVHCMQHCRCILCSTHIAAPTLHHLHCIIYNATSIVQHPHCIAINAASSIHCTRCKEEFRGTAAVRLKRERQEQESRQQEWPDRDQIWPLEERAEEEGCAAEQQEEPEEPQPRRRRAAEQEEEPEEPQTLRRRWKGPMLRRPSAAKR